MADDAAGEAAKEAETGPASAAPEGLACYISPAGLARMRSELDSLMRDERPRVVEVVSWAAGNGDRSENGDYLYGKRRLREIDRRARFLGKRIERARPVDPSRPAQRDRVFFGAAVTIADTHDRQRTVTLLGVDEADTSRGEVSLASPLARALLGRRVGDEVTLQTPGGSQLLEIVAIRYPDESSGRGAPAAP